MTFDEWWNEYETKNYLKLGKYASRNLAKVAWDNGYRECYENLIRPMKDSEKEPKGE